MTSPLPLPLLLALPFLGAALVACVAPQARRLAAWLAGLVALAVSAGVFSAAPAVFGGEVLRWQVAWVPALGLDLSLRLDGLAWMFCMLVGVIGALVVLYAAWYLHPKDPAPRFFTRLLLFMGAMLGVVLAGNLLLMVVFWEATSLTSFLLIGFWERERDARRGARLALSVTGAGGLCLLAGVLLIGHIVGSFDLDTVLDAGATLRAHPLYLAALVLVLLGAFTKSAQFPFHFWLPQAMAAPTPVSAYLHSATMVKAGVFLLARLHPALAGTDAWFWLVSSTGLATLLVGAWAAIFQHDLKGLLAYSTISHLGLITLLFGLGEPLAVVAAVFHILNHATFKAGLFMSAGIVDHECGTRDMRVINGLGKLMPVTATLGIVAALAMAGVPLLNGFLSKEMFFAETLDQAGRGLMQWLLPAGATVAGLFSVAYSARFVHDVFFNGEPAGLPKTPHEAPFFMRLPVGLLVAACVGVGLAPALIAGPLLALAAQASLHATPLPDYTLAIWHGFNAPLLMSLVAIVGGITLYAGLMRTVDLHTIVRLPLAWKRPLRELFTATGTGIAAAARRVTGALENGRLRQYLLLLIVMAVAGGARPFLGDAPVAAPLPGPDAGSAAVALALIGAAAAFGAVFTRRRRLVALLLVGAVGLVVCVAFVALSAPDLALTQLLVEVATVLLLMLALPWLPADSPPEARPGRSARDAAVAVIVGLGTAALAFAMLGLPHDPISPYFLRESLPLGGGANVVNVIIVDFRGFDTLGEITVLCIAALAMHALLSNFGPAARLPAVPAEPPPLMLQIVTGGVLPFTALIAVFLYLRGHNEPGGGFAAGLLLAIGLLAARLGQAGPAVTRLRTAAALVVAGAGLAIAVLTGMASWAFGAPFLTSTYDYPWLPGVGGVPMASAAAFDLGVFLVVVGATIAMLDALARLPGRAGR